MCCGLFGLFVFWPLPDPLPCSYAFLLFWFSGIGNVFISIKKISAESASLTYHLPNPLARMLYVLYLSIFLGPLTRRITMFIFCCSRVDCSSHLALSCLHTAMEQHFCPSVPVVWLREHQVSLSVELWCSENSRVLQAENYCAINACEKHYHRCFLSTDLWSVGGSWWLMGLAQPCSCSSKYGPTLGALLHTDCSKSKYSADLWVTLREN